MLEFKKMHGAGNDFILIDCVKNKFEYSLPILAKFVCDRHYGIGADGMILIYESKIADCKMRIFNRDGSETEICGNGIMCFAKYVFDEKIIEKTKFEIETLSGLKRVKLNFENKKISSIVVNFGKIEVNNLKYIIEIDNEKYLVYPVNVGNPHAVCFVNNVDECDVTKIGSLIENYKYFPNKTNVEFVEILNNNQLKMRVWERGVGETYSCGTGAIASAVIAMKEKYVLQSVDVIQKGGKIKVKYDKSEENFYLIGEPENIFSGKLELI